MRKYFLIFLAILLVVSFATLASFAQEAKEKYVVYVVVHGGIGDPPWELNHRGAQAAAALFPDLELNYVGPTAYNVPEFISYLEAAINAKPDALVCTLTAPEAMDNILKPVIAQGLPVIAINAPDPRPSEDCIPVLSYVGLPDFYEVGVNCAKTFLEYVKPTRVLYCNHAPGATHLKETGRGFLETMANNEIPGEEFVTSEDPVEDAKMTVDYLKAHPDTNVILHPNSTHLEAIIKQLEDEGYKPGKDVFLGHPFDPTIPMLELMEQEKVLFCSDQQMYLQGFYGVMFAYMKAKYGFEPPLPPVTTGPIIITKKDVPALKELIAKGLR